MRIPSWPTSRDIGHANLRSVADSGETSDYIADWLATFTSKNTVANYGRDLRALFHAAGIQRPEQLTDANVIQWANGDGTLSNNTVRSRLTATMSFLRYCRESGLDVLEPTRIARLARRYPKVYGKKNGHHPARWLTKEEAYGQLLDACHDGTPLGLRDELALRLGLAGIRAAEIGNLTIGNVSPTAIDWTGKGRQPRHASIGNEMRRLTDLYLTAYNTNLGRSLQPSDPFICRRKNTGKWTTALDWGQPWADGPGSMWDVTTRRARQAGLGHVAPHDLRRTAAGILHNAKDGNGAHFFDLLDIQKVLGHKDPATTMRSYLDPMDTGVYDRAADYLD